MWEPSSGRIRVVTSSLLPRDAIYFTDEPSIEERTRALWRRQAHLHDVFDPPELVKPTFGDILKQTYIGPIAEALRETNRQFLWGGEVIQHRGRCDKPFYIARLHDWGPVESHGGRCWHCEGLGFLPQVSDYEESYTGIIDCEVCYGTGLVPRTWYRTCQRCNHTETRREADRE